MALDRLRLPREMKIGEMVTGFFVPGLAVWLRGPRLWARAALAGSAALILFFIIWLGYPAANLAFGLLISLHVTGFVYYCNPLMAGERFRSRLAFTGLTLMAIGLLLYMPARNFIQGHWLTPLRMNGQVVVVQRIFQTRNIQRGNWVAYALHDEQQGEAHNGGAVWVRAGMGLGPVLAVAGDQLKFLTNSFSVNGILHTNLPHMPGSGELTMPENHWFIWPNLDISGHGNVSESSISSTLLNMASVNETQFFGKPFHRWFWRKQILP
ncbi:MAG TPA: hypothetical protein DCQ92_18595 [Verrucomicrobia subdivision 3 bacterium]|nr:hypothetical protein [Limisphaerales bacterium]